MAFSPGKAVFWRAKPLPHARQHGAVFRVFPRDPEKEVPPGKCLYPTEQMYNNPFQAAKGRRGPVFSS